MVVAYFYKFQLLLLLLFATFASVHNYNNATYSCAQTKVHFGLNPAQFFKHSPHKIRPNLKRPFTFIYI